MKKGLLFLLFILLTVANINFGFANDNVENKILTATFGDVCSPTDPVCLHNKGLECIGGICNCTTLVSEEKFIYIENEEGCVPVSHSSDNYTCRYDEQCTESTFGKDSFCLKVQYYNYNTGNCECNRNPEKNCKSSKIISQPLSPASQENNWRCELDFQCTTSVPGKYSKCNQTLNTIFGTCVCYDTEGKDRKIIKGYDNICYVQKELGHSCEHNKECNETIAGESICLGSLSGTRKGICKCADRHIFVQDSKECLKLGFINSTCISDLQCNHSEALGQLSRCGEDTKTCACWDTTGFGAKNTQFHQGRCYYSRGVNESCTDQIECILGYHENANCWVHDSYNGAKVCQCSDDHQCDASSQLLQAPAATVMLISTTYMYFCLN